MNTAGEAAECSDGSEVSAGSNHDSVDIADEIAKRSKKAFAIFRRDLNGDGSIEYRCC